MLSVTCFARDCCSDLNRDSNLRKFPKYISRVVFSRVIWSFSPIESFALYLQKISLHNVAISTFHTFDKSTPLLYYENTKEVCLLMKQNLRNGLTYRQVGDYLLPELEVPEAPKVGVWGNRREAYLREQRNGIYTGLQSFRHLRHTQHLHAPRS